MQNIKKLNIPNKSGVYFFFKGKEIIYIGKATSLKDRIKSYFGKDLIETRGPLIVDMIFQSDKIDWQETDSVLEAIILEANLIKKYQPKYNTKEKSDKSFNYVCITNGKLPTVVLMRGKDILNKEDSIGTVFGPYPNGSQLREAMRIIRKIFPYIDANSSKKDNYEFYRQLGLTPDFAVANNFYLQNIKYLKLFFKGKKKDVVKDLKKEMILSAKKKEFERAGEIKRQLFALEHINDVALLKKENLDSYSKDNNSVFRIEAYDIAHMSGKSMVGVMVVIENGEVAKNEYRKFKIKTQSNANDTGALSEVLNRRFLHPEWRFPSIIVVDGGIQQINAAKNVFKNLNLNIPITSVLKDEHHKPKDVLGDTKIVSKYKNLILLANNEAHRFAITYHKKTRAKNFLN